MTKSDQPLLQAFVVSQCPFELRMQKDNGRYHQRIQRHRKAPEGYVHRSVDSINNTIKSMHGVEEAQENLRQICIREEQSEKYCDYVRCT
jgi:hypothetical protein